MKQILVCAALGLLILNPARAAESLELDASETVFAVMAAINAAGYDEGINLPDSHPLRAQLREYLAKQNLPVLPELRRYYQRHLKRNSVEDLSEYLSYALSVTGPPDFRWRTRDVEVPPDALALTEFTPLLIDFYRQANVPELWRRSQPAYQKEMEKYQAPLIRLTTGVQGYLRVPAGGYLGRRFHVFLDLLGAPEQVQTRVYGDDSFVVVTPFAAPPLFDIRHAYLFFEIDPIMIKYGVDLQQKRSLSDLVQNAPLEQSYKDDFVLLSTASLIKAVESRLDKRPDEIAQAARQGYILAPFFGEQLAGFETQPQGMRFYLEEMVKAIDLTRESARVSQITFDKGPLVRASKQVVTEPAPRELSPSGKTLEKAEDLYTARKLDQAKQLYLQALEQQGAAEEHAQCWYGLARISVLENQPDAAVKLFQKTLEASPDAQTKAWSYVYLARLSRASGEPTEAEKMYRAALAVEGASEKAHAAAETELKNLSQNQENHR